MKFKQYIQERINSLNILINEFRKIKDEKFNALRYLKQEIELYKENKIYNNNFYINLTSAQIDFLVDFIYEEINFLNFKDDIFEIKIIENKVERKLYDDYINNLNSILEELKTTQKELQEE